MTKIRYETYIISLKVGKYRWDYSAMNNKEDENVTLYLIPVTPVNKLQCEVSDVRKLVRETRDEWL